MSRVIWKYPLKFGFTADSMSTILNVSDDYKVLCVQTQPPDIPYVWIEVTAGQTLNKMVGFKIVATGREVPEFHTYVGTFQSGWFVGHVYMMEKPDGG